MNLRLISNITLLSIIISFSLYASGGYDNGTSIGKGNLGIDLTWNPFNYWKQGQTYAVISYGLTQKLDIHSYYSKPVSSSDNYYLGVYYQFINYKYLDMATAIGIRKYLLKSNTHLFFPQILYTIYSYNDFRIGGSIVNIIDIKDRNKIIGSALDIALIIPIINSIDNKNRIKSIDLTIGGFRPALWKPDNGNWHPTYSIDMKFLIK